MATPLKKRVTRVTEVNGRLWNISIDPGGFVMREYRCRREIMLPFKIAIVRAAWLGGAGKKKVKRSAV